MFKVYYNGELATDQEFATKKEAKKAVLPVLAGQYGKTIEELKPYVDIEGEYTYTTPAWEHERVCPICGKTFYVKSEKSLKKFCSDECRKEHLRQYNAEFHRNKYYNNDEYRKRLSAINRASTKRHSAKSRWQRRVNIADAILALAQEPNARDLIATFLDKQIIAGGRRGAKNAKYRCAEEVNAEQEYMKIAEKFGSMLDINAEV